MNKEVFFAEIQDSHFPSKSRYFGTHLHEFGAKGLILMSSVLLGKWGFIWAEKSVFYHKKGVHFGLKSKCFIMKKGSFWAEKSVFCHKKGVLFKLENKDGYHFSSEWGSRENTRDSLAMAEFGKPALWALDRCITKDASRKWEWISIVPAIVRLEVSEKKTSWVIYVPIVTTQILNMFNYTVTIHIWSIIVVHSIENTANTRRNSQTNGTVVK